MKPYLAAALAALTVAGMSAAHAEGKTREQVQAELRDAKAAGRVTFGELDYPPAAPLTADSTRAAATPAAAAPATVAPAAAPAAAYAAGKTREQVRAELQQAKAAGQVTFGELDYPPAGN
ncbi:DUF4148 domain-containing protein [Bordetella genomosp. 1]|uniref:DUF4148 domain-containing protein n=1 Tax=Bordetella genomosp. 1 TaxID=1395607 RepID=A0ABX4F697_9BORD|nr:DUF4148 domain-containing protein [Bordetella genomosp. 1]OZI68851.1 hypothetical protein CAL27_05185 [Bordetella genomosp. 1]